MSPQARFTYKYTGGFRFDNAFIGDLKKFILYCEAKFEHKLMWYDDMSDWNHMDLKTLFAFYRYFEAGHCVDHEHITVMDYVFNFFVLPFGLEECKDIYYKQFDGFSMVCFTPNRPASWKYMYFDEKRNVVVPLEIWSARNPNGQKSSCAGYKFWVGAFRSVEKYENFDDYYQCWETIYSNESCEFYVKKNRRGTFDFELPPTENFLPSDTTVITGAGRGVCRNYQWKARRNPILAPIPPEQTIGE